MNSLERTLRFVKGESVDRVPFHPIVMRIVAQWAGVPYGAYCLDVETHCQAAVKMAEAFAMDWVTVMSDPYAEAEAFGLAVEYPENALPKNLVPLITNPAEDIPKLKCPVLADSPRMLDRIEEIRRFVELSAGEQFVVGWVEGPIAEYADLRGLGETCYDLFDCPELVHQAMDVIQENALQLIDAQIEAGANCIGIGDAAASQIGPELYREFVWEREKEMVERVQAGGALAKIHICGDTTALIPDLLATGTDILDIDHLAQDMEGFAAQLSPGQVLCGNIDPVSIVEQGREKGIEEYMANIRRVTGDRCIISAGCEITPGTSEENLRALGRCALG